MEPKPSTWRRATSASRKLLFALGVAALLASLAAGFVQGFSSNGSPPFGALAYGRVAQAHTAAEDYASAAAEYLGEQRINQVHLVASVKLAETLQELGRSEDAIEALRIGAERSLDPVIHVHYAHALAKAERYAEAEQAIVRAIGFDPDNPRLLDRLGKLLASRGRFEEAAEVFERALRLDPTLAETRDSLVKARRYAPDPEVTRGRDAAGEAR